MYNAHQRAQAVLAVWTERRRPAEVCRQTGHQQHAVDSVAATGDGRDAGSVAASLPSRTQLGPALTGKLERLLARQALTAEGKLAKLDKRLAKLQTEPALVTTSAKEK